MITKCINGRVEKIFIYKQKEGTSYVQLDFWKSGEKNSDEKKKKEGNDMEH